MANNRLYLKTKDGNRFLLAKGWGNRWCASADPDKLSAWLNEHVRHESDVRWVTSLTVESEWTAGEGAAVGG